MNRDPVTAETGLDRSSSSLAAEVGQLRALLERELASTRAQIAAATEAEGLMRAQRDQLRHSQVSAEVRVMELQKTMEGLVKKTVDEEKTRWTKLESMTEEIVSLRLDLAREAEQLARAEAIARNAQTEVVQYEAAQRAQIVRIAELQARVEYLEPLVAELEQRLQAIVEKIVKERAAYDAQARGLIEKKKEMEARITELAGARSRRMLMKLGLISRCAWEK
jgi:chromosome segregation ATPase